MIICCTSQAFCLEELMCFSKDCVFLSFIQVFKMLNNKESLDQIIVATPGLSSDAMALGRLPVQL